VQVWVQTLQAGKGGFWKDSTGKNAKPQGIRTFLGSLGMGLFDLAPSRGREELDRAVMAWRSAGHGSMGIGFAQRRVEKGAYNPDNITILFLFEI